MHDVHSIALSYKKARETLTQLRLRDGMQVFWREFETVRHGRIIGMCIGGEPELQADRAGRYVVSVMSAGRHVAVPLDAITRAS